MKSRISFGTVVTMVALSSMLLSARYQPKIGLAQPQKKSDFQTLAMKSFPGRPAEKLVRMAAEIAAFKKASVQEKKQWNDIAQKINKTIKEVDMTRKRTEKHPMILKLKKMRDVFMKKQKIFAQELNKVISKHPSLKAMKADVEKMRANLMAVGQQSMALQKDAMTKAFQLMGPMMQLQALFNKIAQKK